MHFYIVIVRPQCHKQEMMLFNLPRESHLRPWRSDGVWAVLDIPPLEHGHQDDQYDPAPGIGRQSSLPWSQQLFKSLRYKIIIIGRYRKN